MAYKTPDEVAREFNPYFINEKTFGFDFKGLYPNREDVPEYIPKQTTKDYVVDFLDSQPVPEKREPIKEEEYLFRDLTDQELDVIFDALLRK